MTVLPFSHIHVRVGRQVRDGGCRRRRLGSLAAGRPGVSKPDGHCLLRARRCVVKVLSGLRTSRRQILAMFQMGKKRKAWMLDAAQNQQGHDSFAEYRLQISWVDTVANLHQDQLFRSQLFACMKWTSRQRQRNSDRHSSSRFTQGPTGSAQSVNLSKFLKMNISKLI